MEKREESKSNEGKEEEEQEEDKAMKIWDCGSPLYDSYELVSVGHIIDRHIMALPFLGGGSQRLITNEVSPYSSTLIPSTIQNDVALTVSRKARGSSMVGCFSDFVEWNLWKRREIEEREENPKKVKGGFYKICNMIGSWRK